MLNRFAIEDPLVSGHELQDWSKTDFARYLLDLERGILQQNYSALPGYRFMHLGLSDNRGPFMAFSQIHGFHLQTYSGNTGEDAAAIGSLSDLPLPEGVVDITLLQHCLEFSNSPQMALSEACRVTAAGGHVIICVFNPFGPSGLIKGPMQLLTDRPQYRFHALRLGRLVDWLTLLSFEVQNIHHGGFRWPRPGFQLPQVEQGYTKTDKWFGKFDNLCQRRNVPLGNFYMIHAIKRVTRGIKSASRPWQRFSTGRLSASASISSMPHQVHSGIFSDDQGT